MHTTEALVRRKQTRGSTQRRQTHLVAHDAIERKLRMRLWNERGVFCLERSRQLGVSLECALRKPRAERGAFTRRDTQKAYTLHTAQQHERAHTQHCTERTLGVATHRQGCPDRAHGRHYLHTVQRGAHGAARMKVCTRGSAEWGGSGMRSQSGEQRRQAHVDVRRHRYTVHIQTGRDTLGQAETQTSTDTQTGRHTHSGQVNKPMARQ